MPIIIHNMGGGTDVSEATANTENVLIGHTFYAGDNDEIQTGTMPNNGDLDAELSANNEYTYSSGYYNSISIKAPTLSGNALSSHVLAGKTFYSDNDIQKTGTMPNIGSLEKSINVGESYSGNEGYYKTITITGPTLTGNAVESQVLSGKTFYSNNGQIKTGTMTNHGTVTASVGANASYTNTNAGYYSSITVNGPSLTGNATASQVLNGQTFYSNSGTKQTGTMANKGSVSRTLSIGSSYTGSAGYYSSIAISTESLSNIVEVHTFSVGDAIKTTSIDYNSAYSYAAQYVSIPSTNSGVNGIKCWANSSGKICLTQATSGSAAVKDVYLFIIKKK